MDNRQREQLSALCPSVQWNVNMASHSTFRTGGQVEAMVELSDIEELSELLQWLRNNRIPWRVIGGGSNILVTGKYHQGVFIRLSGSMNNIEPVTAGAEGENCEVAISAGCSLPALVAWCVRNGLSGLEFMAGIPGTVGGAIRMNAGAFGHAISEVLTTVRFVTEAGEIKEVAGEEVEFGYRQTLIPGESASRLVITGGVFRCPRADQVTLAARYREILGKRRHKQPRGYGSAGSFFKNPAGDFAGRLIEQAGLKGLTMGKAMVSPVHANFIVNTGGAVPEDIIRLMHEVRSRVQQRLGVLLEPEVHIF
ncbi:UDP-N-acetylmuramate dehydrogenase [Desulfobulbus alkaliphilus]|uniref:UDP-N-acetylmuramate dehydrogenase n=1 Tax=Desulfobulbus alkaliphilus TaxID=869814 RepID=UPI0019653F28|nr:UDP-N-acetylmuramate dehydrogenase [Desulfobulbus alkaliphilus]MBM9536026.1 UDP-N-acetylmuramate dehydrogenase [Desulfobulbus alkaliphilus]